MEKSVKTTATMWLSDDLIIDASDTLLAGDAEGEELETR